MYSRQLNKLNTYLRTVYNKFLKWQAKVRFAKFTKMN